MSTYGDAGEGTMFTDGNKLQQQKKITDDKNQDEHVVIYTLSKYCVRRKSEILFNKLYTFPHEVI